MQEQGPSELIEHDFGKKLRYYLDMLHYTEEPKDAHGMLEASAAGLCGNSANSRLEGRLASAVTVQQPGIPGIEPGRGKSLRQ